MEILKLKNTVTNSLNEFNRRVIITEDRISELENRTTEVTQYKQQRENKPGKK